MGFLKPWAVLFLLLVAANAGAESGQECFLSRFDFSGYTQVRFDAFLTADVKPAGALNSQGQTAGSAGDTGFSWKRVEFEFRGRLPWTGWSLIADYGVSELNPAFRELYVEYSPLLGILSLKAGRFLAPFGYEPQLPSSRLDTVERSLLYQFGNFGWAGPLGFNFAADCDYGLRADYTWPQGFAGLAPFLSAAAMLGKGLLVENSESGQLLLRAGFSSRMELEGLRNDFTCGVSGSCGWNEMKSNGEIYLPIGVAGDLLSNPGLALRQEDFSGRALSMVGGADAAFRINEFTLRGEAVYARLADKASQGYSATFLWSLDGYGLIGLETVLRLEQAQPGFADGAHLPNRWYQNLTFGANWNLSGNWKAQLNYTMLRLDQSRPVFRGSELLLAQVQLNF